MPCHNRAMNLMLLNQHNCTADGLYLLDQRQQKHVRSVLKLNHGDTLNCGLLGGELGEGTLQQIDTGLAVAFTANQPAPSPLPLKLILALPRPKMLKRILIDSTSLGIKDIVLLNSWKVDKSYWQTPELKANLLEQKMLLGLEQAKDTILPELHMANRFKPWIEDCLSGFSAQTRGIIADPSGRESMPCDLTEPVTLAIGPEGGWTDYERDAFIEQGFKCHHLGQRILRVETAVPTIVGRLMRLC